MTINLEPKTWIVLIVDDAPDNLEVARKVLSFAGAQIHVAEDGKKGMTILETVTPTFILLDLSMPNMDGWEMLKAVRQRENGKTMPMIALTAHAMQGDRENIIEAGFDGYISKPFRLASFMKDIQDCLQKINATRNVN